jgi:two-component system response regulator PilR (NtrC family)
MTRAERRSEPAAARVLVVDDEADIRELLELTLLRMGLAVDSAANVGEAHALLRTKQLDRKSVV